MPKLTGVILFRGRIQNLCFYRMYNNYYIRAASALTGKQVKKDPRFRLTMVYAGLLGRAARIGSAVYNALPKDFRRFWMYRAFTGEAMLLLKAGKTDEEALVILSGIYIVPIRVAAKKTGEIKTAAGPVNNRRAVARRTLRIQKPLKEFYTPLPYSTVPGNYRRTKRIISKNTFRNREPLIVDSS